MPNKSDYYEVLGVSKSANADEIKHAFRKQAVKYHPDKDGGDEAKFKEVNEAYEILKDSQKRAAYDQFGHAGVGAGPGAAGFSQDGTYNVNFDGYDFSGMGGLGDIFDMFFRGGVTRARDVEVALTIDFEESFKGSTKELQLRVMDRRKNERVSENVKVKIPAGIDDGQSIRLSGRGEVAANGQRGDLYVHVSVRPDHRFIRQGANIVSNAEVDMADAALGTEITVETLDGKIKVKIPVGTQNGKLIRLSGRGMPIPGSTRRGDQLINVTVLTPTKLSTVQKKLLEQFKSSPHRRFF